MKGGIIAVATAALAAGVNAAGHAGRRHAHEAYHMARGLTAPAAAATCECTTIYTTVTGQGVLLPPPTSAVVPTPEVTTVQPGTHTIPATTITLTSSTTVCGAASTHVPSGTHTLGGVTTVVKTSTTVVCPVATATTDKDGVVTSHLTTTTYVCPAAGTYTIGAETTHVTAETVVVYPTPAEYAPGTYTHDEIVTTVTKTDYVLFCPLTVKVEPTPAPAPAPTPAPAPEAVKVAEAPKSDAPPKVENAPAPILYESPAPASAAPATQVVEPVKQSSAPAPSGQLGVTGEKWALTYTPYTEDAAGLCKDKAAVEADIALIASKGFTAVRVYSTDCSALEHIPAACAAHGIKLILGVFIDKSGIPGAQVQVDAILAWGQFKMVDLVVVGNEALFSNPPRASGGELAAFINSVKSSLRSKGYSGPVTTAEPLNVWQANAGALCDAVDVVGLNIHPFFNADVEASQAGKFAKGQLEIAAALCPGKDAFNLETGWPSHADRCNGKACAGASQQAAAIASIMSEIGGKSVMFSFGNDGWKLPGEFGCEQFWGSIQLY